MNANIKKVIETDAEVSTLEIDAHMRYLEDTTYSCDGEWVNCNENDSECPCTEGHQWKPIIDVNTGQILNWSADRKFWVFGKVCDEFKCKVKGINDEVLIDYEGYVPNCMSINDKGYGDYIDMIVNPDGIIQDWEFKQSDIDYMNMYNLNN